MSFDRRATSKMNLYEISLENTTTETVWFKWELFDVSNVNESHHKSWKSQPLVLKNINKSPAFVNVWSFEARVERVSGNLIVSVKLVERLNEDGSVVSDQALTTISCQYRILDAGGKYLEAANLQATSVALEEVVQVTIDFQRLQRSLFNSGSVLINNAWCLGVGIKTTAVTPKTVQTGSLSVGYEALMKDSLFGATLPDHFGSMLKDEEFVDVTLVSDDGIRFPCHKAVLAHSSPVFRAMFTIEMAEKNKKEISISLVSGIALGMLLEFIYTGKWSGLGEHTSINDLQDLLVASDLYQMQKLKALCQLELMRNMNIERVCDFIKLADLCKCDGLRSVAVRFLNDNLTAVSKTEGWNRLLGPKASVPQVLPSTTEMPGEENPNVNAGD